MQRRGGSYFSDKGGCGSGICETTSNSEAEVVIKVEGGAYLMTLNFSVKEPVIKKAE